VDFCKQKDKLMGNLKNSVVSYTDHTNEVRKELKTSGKIYYQIVIVSNRNISKEKWASNQAQITDLKSVNNYVLTEDVHPNYLSKNPSKAFSDMKINLGEFKKLLKDIRRF
jgi:peptide methionine sulfoxide reductase MsrA